MWVLTIYKAFVRVFPWAEGQYKAFAKTEHSAPPQQNNNNNNNSNLYDSDEEYGDWDFNNNNNNSVSPAMAPGDVRREISVYAYGEKDTVGPILLDNGDEDLFAPGKEEEFDVSASYLPAIGWIVFIYFLLCI